MSVDLGQLRQFVTGADHLQYTNLAEGVVQLHVTHNLLKAHIPELRLNLHMKIEELKHKLYRHVGTPVEYQRLILKGLDGAPIGELADGARPLGFYSPQNGMTIHVIDENPHSLAKGGGLEDVNLVKKYEMTEDEYDQRPGTLREYKKKKLAEDPNFKFFPKASGAPTEPTGPVDESTVAHAAVGQRCEVQPGARRGEVRFVGPVPEAGIGHWIGVAFDEPLGKHNGTVKGTAYFECGEGHGTFARGRNVKTGDYPEVDPLADDDSDDEL